MKKVILISLALLTLLFTGCATLEVTTKFIDPQYKPEMIRTANILVGIQENVESFDFEKPFYELFESDMEYSHLYSDSLKLRLRKKFPQAYVIPSDNDSLGVILKFKSIPQIQSYCAPFIKNGLPTYLVQINKTSIIKKVTYNPGSYNMTTGVYKGAYTQTDCVAKFDVDVIELNDGKLVHSFIVSDQTVIYSPDKSAIKYTLSLTLNGLVNSLDQLILKPESSDDFDVKW